MKFLRPIAKSAVSTFEKELAHYQTSAQDTPDDARIHIKIAELYLKHNQKDKAVEEYLRAAQIYKNKNVMQIAMSIYNRVITIVPDSTEIYHVLADIYLKNGFTGDAVATLEKLAHHYYESGNKSEAIKVLNNITEIDPHNKHFKLKVNKFYEAKQIEEEYDIDYDVDVPVPLQSDNFQTSEQNTDDYFFDLESALQEDSSLNFPISEYDEDSDDSSPLINTSTSQNHYDAILDEIKLNVDKTPALVTPNFHYNFGKALQQLGKLEEAIREFEQSIENGENVSDCYVQIVKCLHIMNQTDRAEEYINRGLILPSLNEQEKIELTDKLNFIKKQKAKKSFFYPLTSFISRRYSPSVIVLKKYIQKSINVFK